jgi:hypothetical protein
MTEFNLSFLDLMRIVKEGDRIGCSVSDHLQFLELKNSTMRWNHSDRLISQPWAWRYRILKPNPKLIKWYFPIVVWQKGEYTPMKSKETEFLRNKDITGWGYDSDTKVLEWEMREFPATWNDAE